jgi:hypothetical protein
LIGCNLLILDDLILTRDEARKSGRPINEGGQRRKIASARPPTTDFGRPSSQVRHELVSHHFPKERNKLFDIQTVNDQVRSGRMGDGPIRGDGGSHCLYTIQ